MTTWTGTVPTFTAGDTTTVPTNLNTVRDALKALSEAWTAYTPTWTGATTNPVLNNGSFSGSAYCRIGKLVHFRIVLTMGTTTTYGTGQWRLTLPTAPLSTARQTFVADLIDTGINGWNGRASWDNAASALALHCEATSAAGAAYKAVATGVPFSWGNGDQVCIVGTYEAA